MPEGTLQLEHLMVKIPIPSSVTQSANFFTASYEASTAQESNPDRHRDHSGYLLDVR
jgi:hypothetical protein